MAEIIRVQVISSPLDEAGLRALISERNGFELVQHSCCCPVCNHSCITDSPHVLVIKLTTDDGVGYDCIRELSSQHPKTHILSISPSASSPACQMALRAGAIGFVSQQASAQMFIEALHQVALGKPFVEPLVARRMAKESKGQINSSPFDILSKREYAILQLMLTGLNNKAIAGSLHISINTLGNHRSHIKNKLAVTNLVELTKLAIKHGIK